MLTPRQNYLEAVKGGKPERFANGYEAIHLCLHPMMFHSNSPKKGEENVVNAWGVTNSYPEGTPGAFPVHTPDKIVIKDIEHWRDYVHAPDLSVITQADIDLLKRVYDSVDTNLTYNATFVAPGLFEQCHHLGEMVNTLTNLMIYEDEMHDLIKYLTEYEMKIAEIICDKLKPDCLFHHDDWGGRESSFLNPDMFADYFVEPYKQIYGYYKSHGVQLVVHHSDSYGANLVPHMIEMGIDVWQGCMSSNNIPELTEKYRGKIGFMGGFDGADFDTPDWTEEDIRAKVWAFLDKCSPSGFVPCIAQGGPGSVYPGVYEAIMDAVDDYNEKKFGVKKADIVRSPMQLESKGYMA